MTKGLPVSSLILWGLVLLFGVPIAAREVGRRLVQHVRRASEIMAKPSYEMMPFAEFPRWVLRRLARRREEFLALGFREITTYFEEKDRPSYVCVLVSQDGHVVADLWVARFKGLMLWVTLGLGWPAFWREIRAAGRYSLTTHYSELRQFETTPVEFMKRDELAGQREYLIVPFSLEAGAALARHVAGARAFATAHDLGDPVPVLSDEDFFRFAQATRNRFAADLRRQAASLDQLDDD